MAEPTQQDVTEIGLDRMLSQWSDKVIIRGLFESYLDNIQVVEDMWFQLLNERDIFTAIGEQLNVLGTIVGEARLGKGDDEYRQAILNRVALNSSDGTPPRVLEILTLITEADNVTLFEHFPGNVHYMTDGITTDTTTATMDVASSAGVSVRVMVDVGSTSFIPAALIQDQDLLGVNTGDIMGVDTGEQLGVASFTLSPVGDRSFLPFALDPDTATRVSFGGTTTPLNNPLCAVL